jgi:hypothetical protein
MFRADHVAPSIRKSFLLTSLASGIRPVGILQGHGVIIIIIFIITFNKTTQRPESYGESQITSILNVV